MESTNNVPPAPEWLTINRICAELDVTRPTVEGWIKSGQLGHHKLGPRIIRIRRDDLEEFLEHRRRIRSRCSAPGDVGEAGADHGGVAA